MRADRQLLPSPALIRPGSDEDAPGFIALIETCWAAYPGCVLDVDREAPELCALATYYRDRGGMLWVADDAHGMVATAPLGDGAWEICRVYVHPTRHGTGLGRDLLHLAERHAIAAGAAELVLWTDTRFHRAHRFYERESYVRAGPLRALHDITNTIEYRYAKPISGVQTLDVAAAQSAKRRLATLLIACLDAGASVSFLPPLAPDRAAAFWQGVTRRVGEGQTMLFAAWKDATLAGTVQLALDMPENGRHRAVVQKLLVHPGFRRRGLGNALMQAAETAASAIGRTLLELDTRAGDPAEALYRRRRWTEAGRIAGYTREADGTFADTIIFTHRLNP